MASAILSSACRAVLGGGVGPGVERRVGRGVRAADVLRARHRRLCVDLARGRVDDVVGLSGHAVDGLSVDDVAEREVGHGRSVTCRAPDPTVLGQRFNGIRQSNDTTMADFAGSGERYPCPAPGENDSILGCLRGRSPRYGLGRGNHDCSRAQHRTTTRRGGGLGAGAALGLDTFGGGGGGPARDAVGLGCERLRAARERDDVELPHRPGLGGGPVRRRTGGRWPRARHRSDRDRPGARVGQQRERAARPGRQHEPHQADRAERALWSRRCEPGRGGPQQQSGAVHRWPGLLVGPQLRRTARRRHPHRATHSRAGPGGHRCRVRRVRPRHELRRPGRRHRPGVG